MIPELRHLSCEERLKECGLTTLEIRQLRGDQTVFNILNGYENKKVRSYIARYPVLGTAQSALHFTPWSTCSFQRHLDFSGKHSATLQLLREDYSFRYPPLSVARYSLIQLSELWQPGFSRLIARRSSRNALASQ